MADNRTIIREHKEPGFFGRMFKPVGEISVLRDAVKQLGVNLLGNPYKLDSKSVNYELARQLYRNSADNYKLGSAFARPIINTTAGFMGAPVFKHEIPDAHKALEEKFRRNTGKILRINRNTLREADCFARWVISDDPYARGNGKKVINLVLIPPERVDIILDPISGGLMEVIIKHPIQKRGQDGAVETDYNIIERITKDNIKFEFDAKAPADVRALYPNTSNTLGFIPIVHFKNESEEGSLYGFSDIEPVEPFIKAYHDTMLAAIQGAKLFNRPKSKFKLKDVEKFLADNFTAEERKSGKLNFAGREIFLLQAEDDISFITAEGGISGATTLLEFLYYCIVDVSETPEFVFGTAVSSSKASVSEQMIPLARKIERKRGQFEDPYIELASMYLAVWSQLNNKTLNTYQADIEWEELSGKSDKEVAETIKSLVDGLSTAVDGRMISIQAASDFLRQFIPTMLPYIDTDSKDKQGDESRRIVTTAEILHRLKDGTGLPADGGGE